MRLALSVLAGIAMAACRPASHPEPTAARSPAVGVPTTPAPEPAAIPTTRSPERDESLDDCLDRVTREAGLNRYGDPANRMYAGGTPLFDESTGQTIERIDYIAQRRPDLAARCRPDGG